MFKQIREHPKEVYDIITAVPYGRQILKEAWKYEHEDEIQQAVDMLILLTMNYGGMLDRFGVNKDRTVYNLYRRYLSNIPAISKILQNVILEHKDWIELIPLYDRKETLFYLDPPYLGTSQETYSNQFTEDDFKRLKEVLSGIEGYAILSHSKNEFVEKIFKDWDKKEVEMFSALDRRSEHRRVEVLYANFSIDDHFNEFLNNKKGYKRLGEFV